MNCLDFVKDTREADAGMDRAKQACTEKSGEFAEAVTVATVVRTLLWHLVSKAASGR